MQQTTKSDRLINTGFFVAIIVLIGLGFFLQDNIREVQKRAILRAQARKTAFKIKEMISLVTDAETAQRGYLLTNDKAYLEPYNQASAKLPIYDEELALALRDLPKQSARLTRARPLWKQKLSELDLTIHMRSANHEDQALAVVKQGAGLAYMTELRKIFHELEDEQIKLIEYYQRTTDQLSEQCGRIVQLASFFVVLIVAAMAWALNRNRKQRDSAARSLQDINRALESRRKLLSKVVSIQNEIALAPKNADSIMGAIVTLCSDLTAADGAIVEVIEGQELVYRYVCGDAQTFLNMRIPIDGSFSGLAIEQGTTLVCNDSEQDPRVNLEACRRVGLRSMIVVPLQYGDRTIAVIKTYSKQAGHFDDTLSEAMNLVAGAAASALGLGYEFEEKVAAISDLESAKIELILSRDQAQSATEAKSRFLANMSHEVRTPLNGILGMSTLLLDEPLDSGSREYATAIKTSGESLLALVNDILDFSKIEAGRLVFEKLDFDLVSTMQDILKSFSYVARQKNLKLNLECDSTLPNLVNGDPGRIRQILMNLIGNAVKFTSQGSVSVRLTCLDPKAVRLKFEVKDTGIGISAESARNLFQEFTQADASTTRVYGGTGLGLAISKRLVEQMNGHIAVDSKLGEGSTFSFEIELSPAVSRSTEMIKGSVVELPAREKPWRVLVGEDNQVNQIIISKMLEKIGVRCELAGNGKEVIAALQSRSYDLVLMDCHMPEMDGYDATAFIRESKSIPDNRIPIIAMTANAMQGDREKTIAAGMDDYLSKPVDVKKLRETLAKWLTLQLERSA